MRWKKVIYIAKKKNLEYDDYGNQVVEYEEPVKYMFNVQPVSSNEDLVEFGEKASTIQKAVIPMSYFKAFKEGDKAYLDGQEPLDEERYGDNANYLMLPPRNQNKAIIIYFERITGK